MGIPCDRCLEQVLVEIPYSIERKLDMKQSDEDRVEDLDENDYLTGTDLDVDRLVYLEVLMNWPLKVLCREDCKGVCPKCGVNLNYQTCNCDRTELDPRMSIIREIFALLGAPLFVRYFGRLSPICAGGATTMDTTLPIITRYCGKDLVFVSIFHGILVDFTVPFFVSFFCSM